MTNILEMMSKMSDRIEMLEDNLKESVGPQSYQCGYQPRWGSYSGSPKDGPIVFDRLLFTRNDPVWGLANGLDIETGVFTSQYSGVYEISWSLIGRDENTNVSSEISLYKNHVKILESYQDTYFSGASGIVQETGGRQMYVELNLGDTLHLHCNECFIVSVIHFCVKLDYPLM